MVSKPSHRSNARASFARYILSLRVKTTLAFSKPRRCARKQSRGVSHRRIGGLCARSLRFSFEGESEPIGLEELLLRHALELPGWNSPRERIASGVMMIPVPKSGVLEAVSGEDAARSVPGISELTITARLHDAIATWPEGSSYLGFLFASGDPPEKVDPSLREAHEKLSFTITPRLPVEHPATRRMTNQGN